MRQELKQQGKSFARWLFINGFIAPLVVFLATQGILWLLVAFYGILPDTPRFYFFLILEGLSLTATFIIWWRRP